MLLLLRDPTARSAPATPALMLPDIDVRTEYDRLAELYDTSGRHLDHDDARLFAVAGDVSGWSPARHLYHIWLANGRSLTAARFAATGRRTVDEGAPTDAGRVVLAGEQIPKGQMEAPDSVRPPDTLDRPTLEAALDRSRTALTRFGDALGQAATADGRIEHPALGALTAPQWARFVRIHTEHHLAIVDDILAQAAPAP